MSGKFWEILGFIAALVFIFEGRALVKSSDRHFEISNQCFEAPSEKEAVANLERYYQGPLKLDPETGRYTYLDKEGAEGPRLYHARIYQVWDEYGRKFKACL